MRRIEKVGQRVHGHTIPAGRGRTMAVTLRQIAEMAGVSRGTVDRVINNRGHVNEEVETRIRRIAEELGYQPNTVGRALAKAKNELKIGVLIQSVETPTMQTVAQGAEEAANALRAQGTEVIIRRLESLGEQKELDAIDELVADGIKGLALAPSDEPQVCAHLNRIIDQGIPVVTFNGDAPKSRRLCFVGMDNRRGGQTAAGLVRAMLPQGGKVLPLSAHPNNHGHRLRYTSFAEKMEKIAPNVQVLPLQHCFNRDDYAYELTLRAFEENPDLSVIYVTAHGQHGACRAIEKAGLFGKVRVIAYDLTPQNRIDLAEDRIEFILDQNAAVQGRAPLHILQNYLLSGEAPPHENMFTDILIKTKYNI